MLPWKSHNTTSHKKYVRIFFAIFAFALLCSFFWIQPTHAQTVSTTLGVDVVDSSLLLASTDIRIIAVRIINVLLGFLGVITLGLILYAGFLIMTSGGAEDKIAQGRKIMINAVIGLVIIMSAWAITKFILNSLLAATTGMPPQDAPITLSNFGGSGGLGRVIQDHYPFRDDRDVARNTSIVITFVTPVKPSSFVENTNNTCLNNDGLVGQCDDVDNPGFDIPYYGDCVQNTDGYVSDMATACDQLVTSSIAIFPLDDVSLSSSGYELMTSTTADLAFVSASAMLKYESVPGSNIADSVYTIVLRPHNFLGNGENPQWYGVYVDDAIIKKGTNESIFAGQFSPYYYWNFQTGTELDIDPPRVVSVFPQNAETVAKNVVTKITFSEAVDPIVASGILKENGNYFHALVNMNSITTLGTWRLSNGYRTMEFISATPCGQNSCGDVMYCLPVTCENSSDKNCTNLTHILLRTAEPTNLNPDIPFESWFDSGIYDLAFNGLDTNNSKELTKPIVSNNMIITISEENIPDNYYFNFNAQNRIDRESPYAKKIIPAVDTEDIVEKDKTEIFFSKSMRISTINDIELYEYPVHVCSTAALSTSTPNVCSDADRLDDLWYVTYGREEEDTQSTAYFKHRDFGPYDLDLYYFPQISHTVQDSFQNCVYPGRGPESATIPLNKADAMLGDNCSVVYDEDGNVTSSDGCINVLLQADKDSGCSFATNAVGSSNGLLQASSSTCRTYLESISNSDY